MTLIVLALLAQAAGSPTALPHRDPPPAGEPATVNMTAKQLFVLADKARASGRFEDAALIFQALAKDPDPEIRAEARFRLGRMLTDRKQYKDAAIAFRQLLDEKPNAASVRLELARVLALMGDIESARHQVRQAQAAGLPADVASLVDQFARALRSRKRVGGSIELALAPDTNINRATSATTLDTIIAPLTLDRDARAQSGVGLKVGAQGFARVPVADHLDVLARVSTSAALYDAHQFDDISGSVAVGPEWTNSRERLQPAIVATRRYYGGNFYAQTEGGSINWTHAIGRKGQFETEFSASRSRYALNSLQDGAILDGSVTVERAFSPRLGGSFTLSATRQSARDPGYATASGGASLVVSRELGAMTVYATAGYRHLGSDARLALYLRSRTDDYFRIAGGCVFRKLAVAGAAPLIRVSWERNASTVGIYDFRRTAIETGISRAF